MIDDPTINRLRATLRRCNPGLERSLSNMRIDDAVRFVASEYRVPIEPIEALPDAQVAPVIDRIIYAVEQRGP